MQELFYTYSATRLRAAGAWCACAALCLGGAALAAQWAPAGAGPAAAWESVVVSYGGWPRPLVCTTGPDCGWNTPNAKDAVLSATVAASTTESVSTWAYDVSSIVNTNPPYYAVIDDIDSAGSLPPLPPGTPVMLEWACQSSQTTLAADGSNFFRVSYYDGAQINWGSGSSTEPNQGSLVVSPRTSTTYTLACNSTVAHAQTQDGTSPYTFRPAGVSMSLTVPVIVPQKPAVTLDAGAGDGAPATGYTGQPVLIVATYAAGQYDALGATAINGPDATDTSIPCAQVTPYSASCWLNPDGLKRYLFVPQAPGTYTFYAAAKSAFWGWDNYRSVKVTVADPCLDGSGAAGTCTACNAGFVLVSGTCQPQCPNGTGTAGNCTSCNSGYVFEAGSCVAEGGNIVQPLSASPPHVRVGAATSLSWATRGMKSCTVSDDTGRVLSTAKTSSGTPTAPLNRRTTFTLTCYEGNPHPRTSALTITPAAYFIEI